MARNSVAPKDAAVAGSVLTRDRLVGPGLQAQDVLRTQPGVAVTELGGFGAPATAAIRGATAGDTPVYLAGVRMNDDVGGTADLSLVPLWLVDRIEIYRGNAPIEADRLGPGGAIFFEPRTLMKDMGGAGYYGGSWGASKGWAYQAVRSGGASALVGVSADHATNRYPFVNDHGERFEPGNATTEHRQNADETTVEGWSLARVELARGATVDVFANAITREQGVPGLALLQAREARERADRLLGSVGVHAPIGREAAIDSRTSILVGSTAYHDPLLELSLRARDLRISGRRVEQSTGATWDVTDALRLRGVVDVAHEGVTRDPANIPLGRTRREFARAAASVEERPGDWITLHVLASGECHHTGATPDDVCDVLTPTGRLGVDVGMPRVRVLANIGRYVRVPTLGEVYGVSGDVHGNRDLAPESGTSADLGVRAQTRRGAVLYGAYVDAFLFAHWVDGLIAYERTAQGYVTPYNVGRARVLGAEVLAGLALTKLVRAEVAFTALDPRDTSPDRTTVNDVLPFRSRVIVAPRLRADYKTQNRAGLSGFGGEIRALYQSSRYVDPAGLGVIGEQATFDIEADVAWFNGLLIARGRVADIFDAARTDVIGYVLP
ncbi:MAG TPA: TonB-dependent receptor, partial [Polyangiaceae bacterium]|nr:TonB-dependent receptor [Polyangiaceae bacterium]